MDADPRIVKQQVRHSSWLRPFQGTLPSDCRLDEIGHPTFFAADLPANQTASMCLISTARVNATPVPRWPGEKMCYDHVDAKKRRNAVPHLTCADEPAMNSDPASDGVARSPTFLEC